MAQATHLLSCYEYITNYKHTIDTEVRQGIMTQETIIGLISQLCEESHLSYDNSLPTQVSPGIWQFNAVEKSETCMKHGHCRQMQYYAMSTGTEMKLC